MDTTHIVYSYAFDGNDPAHLLAWVQLFSGRLVVDARGRAHSQDLRWHRDNLEALFGDRYIHLPKVLHDDAPAERKRIFAALRASNTLVVLAPKKRAVQADDIVPLLLYDD